MSEVFKIGHTFVNVHYGSVFIIIDYKKRHDTYKIKTRLGSVSYVNLNERELNDNIFPIKVDSSKFRISNPSTVIGDFEQYHPIKLEMMYDKLVVYCDYASGFREKVGIDFDPLKYSYDKDYRLKMKEEILEAIECLKIYMNI